MADRRLTFLEFFAGGGMARAGLGESWQCLFANDFDETKVATYVANYGHDNVRRGDVAKLALSDLPAANPVDLCWASFPCQDLSLAGDYRGLGRERDDELTRSGTFWPFWKLVRELVRDGRAPRTIVLENVYGCLTSHSGRDFAAIASALSNSGYRFGAMVINAVHFVPQSRPRVFFLAVRKGEAVPDGLVVDGPQSNWHPAALVEAYAGMTVEAKKKWLWLNIPTPAARNAVFADLIEENPTSIDWHTSAETKRLLGLMSPVNRSKVTAAKRAGRRTVGCLYRRTRTDKDGLKRQRAEVRFDSIAGCLRTPAGGSSRQIILVVDGNQVRSRLLSSREAARLMGLSDDYKLPLRYNDAYHVCGDGVCVPVVRHIARHFLEPLLAANESEMIEAAEYDLAIDLGYRRKAVRTLTNEIGCYALCDLDQVPIYVGQSVDGIRSRVNRHLTSARSDIIANRQVDVWEIAWVWTFPVEKGSDIGAIEDALFHEFHPKSALMNGKVPRKPSQKIEVPKPFQTIQVMADVEIAEKKDPALRLPRQAEHYSQIVGHFLAVKNSKEIAGAIQAHFERLQKYHRELLGLAVDVEGDSGDE